MQRTHAAALCALFVLPAAACTATDEARRDLGSVPLELVELYDTAAPDGTIEIEIDREGKVREMEADVRVELLPRVVADAAMAYLPAGRVVGAERELTTKGEAWEVKFDVGGIAWEVVVDEDGRIIETEQAIDRRTAPQPVLNTAGEHVRDGLLLSVELITRGDEQEYHVKKERLGATYKLVIAPDGRLMRKVREARAEIEIPLAQ